MNIFSHAAPSPYQLLLLRSALLIRKWHIILFSISASFSFSLLPWRSWCRYLFLVEKISDSYFVFHQIETDFTHPLICLLCFQNIGNIITWTRNGKVTPTKRYQLQWSIILFPVTPGLWWSWSFLNQDFSKRCNVMMVDSEEEEETVCSVRKDRYILWKIRY